MPGKDVIITGPPKKPDAPGLFDDALSLIRRIGSPSYGDEVRKAWQETARDGSEEAMGQFIKIVLGATVGGLVLAALAKAGQAAGKASAPREDHPTTGDGWGRGSGWRLITDPVVPTWNSRADFATVIAERVRAIAPQFGYEPIPTDEMMVAWFAHETGWGAHCRGNNYGGIHAGANWKGPYFNSTDAGTPTKFAAFKDLDDFIANGAFLFLGWTMYGKSAQLLRAGDDDFYAQLGRDGYYTADPARYKKSCVAARKEARKYLGR